MQPRNRSIARSYSISVRWILVLAISLGTASHTDGQTIGIGTAAVDITPRLGTPMAGYYYQRAATGIHDPLWARAMVFDDGRTKVAIVSLDLISTTEWMVEQARAEIEKTVGIAAGHVMIAATHAHTGPMLAKANTRYDALGATHELAQQYMANLPKLIAKSVAAANKSLAPCSVQAAIGIEPGLAFNRRFFMKDGSVGWNPGKINPQIEREAGPVDSEIPLLVFLDAQRNPTSVFTNFAIHLDMVGGTEFSADMPHTLIKLLGEAKGQSLFTLYTTGCCGDVNHVNVRTVNPQKGHEEATRAGIRLAAGVLRAWDSLQPTAVGSLKVSQRVVPLPLPEITEPDIARAEEIVRRMINGQDDDEPKFMELVEAFRVLDVRERQGKSWEAEVQVFALGDQIAFVSLPGEIFVELGISIKRASPFRYTVVSELANGSLGYIPNRIAYSQGNYEVVSARCAAGSGELLVDSAISQLRELYAQPQAGNQ